MSHPRGRSKYSSSPIDLEYTATIKDFNDMTMSEKFDQPPKPSPTPTSFSFPAMRSTSAASSQESPSKLGANSRTESRHMGDHKEEKMEKIEKLLVFKDEVKAAGASQANRKLKSPATSKKKTSKTMTRPLKLAASSHARSKSASSLSKAQLPVSSQTTEPHDYNTPIKISATKSAKLQILEQLQNIAHARADIHLQLSTLDKHEKTLVSILLQSELSTVALQAPEPSTENDVSVACPLTQTRMLPPCLDQPIPILASSPYQPRKKPHLPCPPRPISAPPQSTPSRLLTRTPITSTRIPLSDKTETSIATFDSTPIFMRPSCEVSPVKTHYGAEALEEMTQVLDVGMGIGKGVRVPMKFGDEDDREMAKEGEVETGHWEVTDRGCELLALIDQPIRPAERTATPGKQNTTLGDYEIPHTVQRKDWRF